MTLSPARQVALATLHEGLRARTAARIEDLEFLVDQGSPIEEAARRVGWTPAAAARALYRYGRRDLARPLSKVEWMQRRDA